MSLSWNFEVNLCRILLSRKMSDILHLLCIITLEETVYYITYYGFDQHRKKFGHGMISFGHDTHMEKTRICVKQGLYGPFMIALKDGI